MSTLCGLVRCSRRSQKLAMKEQMDAMPTIPNEAVTRAVNLVHTSPCNLAPVSL
jgi:hypothetical protein